MGIFLTRKNTLRCPECGGYADKNADSTKNWNYMCPQCNCELITEDEYQSYSHIYAKPTVECPYCHSTNTKKISATSKAGSVALFGIFALGKVSKQWHCNKCGSEF